jgi:hypothetical protein
MLEAELTQVRRRGLWLEGISMPWTLTVAAVAIAAGVAASSVALVGLGLESVIELLAAAIVIWGSVSVPPWQRPLAPSLTRSGDGCPTTLRLGPL